MVGDLAVGQIVVKVVGGKRVVVKGGSGGEQWDLVANYCSVCVIWVVLRSGVIFLLCSLPGVVGRSDLGPVWWA